MTGRGFAQDTLRCVTLLVTGRCNLGCAYCFQESRRASGRRMPWAVAQRAVDLLLSSQTRPVTLDLSGGEPLLEPALVRRLIEYVRLREPDSDRLEIVLTTNGTRLTPAIIAHLAERDVVLRLSFDGVREAQRARGDWTFDRLDRLIDRVRETQPEFFVSRVEVVMTLAASSVPHFAASVRYFLAKGVARTLVSPRITPDAEWGSEMRESLRGQVEQVVDASLQLWRTERRCPVSFLEGPPIRRTGRSGSHTVCGVASGRSICVDWEGRCWPCVALARAITSLKLPRGGVARAFDLGHLEDRQMPRHLSELPSVAQRTPAFAAKTRMRSVYGPCRNCEYFGECVICPAALCHGQASGALYRVPDLLCAFNQVALAARRRFHDQVAVGADVKGSRCGSPSLGEIGILLRAAVRAGGDLAPPD